MGLAKGSIVVPAQDQIVDDSGCRQIHQLLGGGKVLFPPSEPVPPVCLRNGRLEFLQLLLLLLAKARQLLFIQQPGILENIRPVLHIVVRLLDIALITLVRGTHQGIEDIYFQPGVILPKLFETLQPPVKVLLAHLVLPGRDKPAVEQGIGGNDGRLGLGSVFLQPLPKLIGMAHISGAVQKLPGGQQHLIARALHHLHRLMVGNGPVIVGYEKYTAPFRLGTAPGQQQRSKKHQQ